MALAVISGSAVLNLLIWLVCIGLVFWLIWWLISFVNLPEPFAKIARVILAVAGVVVLINVLLEIAGHPFMRW
jgi:uncharacterized protein YhhL (DUF1145 family)